MDICHSTDFDAPTEEVYGLLTHRDFQREKARRLDALAFDMDTQVDGPRTTVVTKRKVATAGLPEFVKSMLTPSMVVVETEVWDSPPAGNSPTGEPSPSTSTARRSDCGGGSISHPTDQARDSPSPVS